MGSSSVINNANDERCIFYFKGDYGQRNIMPVSQKLRKYFLVDHEIVSFTCPQIISINYDDQLRGYYGRFCFVFYSFLRAEGKVVNYKGKNKFPYSFLVCCCYQSVFVSVSACCGQPDLVKKLKWSWGQRRWKDYRTLIKLREQPQKRESNSGRQLNVGRRIRFSRKQAWEIVFVWHVILPL